MNRMLRVNATLALALTGLLWAAAPDAPVADAAMRGDVTAVRALIQKGADVNAAQGDGMTGLHWAAMNGNTRIAELLIAAGASVKALTRLGDYTPLHLASKAGHVEVAKVLLDAGADATALTSTGGVTALHFAAQTGNVEMIALLVAHGADVNAQEQQWGDTPLMFAATYDRAPAVQALLARGADPALTARVIDMVKRDAENRAAEKRRKDLYAQMRKMGNLDLRTVALAGYNRPAQDAADTREDVALIGGQPPTAVSAAAEQGGPELIGFYGGQTALTLAARDGSMEAAAALLDGGADVNQVTAGDHTSPLLMAAINGQFDVAMLLLERGAKPTLASDNGNTPLFATIHVQWNPKSRQPQPAASFQQKVTYLELMQALLEAGANPNTRLRYEVWYLERGDNYLSPDWIGITPFFRAAHADDIPAMRLLVKYGADPNVPSVVPADGSQGSSVTRRAGAQVQDDPSGLPPVVPGGPALYPINAAAGYGHGDGNLAYVHRHVANGELPAVKYLVEELGADVNARDLNSGTTPLHDAASRGDNELILYLMSRGADIKAVNRRGQTVADMANGPNQSVQAYPATVRLLESLGSKNNHHCVSC